MYYPDAYGIYALLSSFNFKLHFDIVLYFNVTKGFGFITPNDGSADVFVHQSGLIDTIKDNDDVQFETERGKKSLNAVRVQVIQ